MNVTFGEFIFMNFNVAIVLFLSNLSVMPGEPFTMLSV